MKWVIKCQNNTTHIICGGVSKIRGIGQGADIFSDRLEWLKYSDLNGAYEECQHLNDHYRHYNHTVAVEEMA